MLNQSVLRQKQHEQCSTIGNYNLHNHLLGQGSFSKIYLGSNIQTGQRVAIKLIDMNMINSRGLKKFLDNEIQINKTVEHAYVLRCYQISYTPAFCYIVTEYCPDGDLHKYIRKRGTLTEAQAVILLKQLVTALKYLHGQNIIHRDLKSSNVFLKNGSIKIADFGLSHQLSKNKQQDRWHIGTPAYMAPESINDKNYSYKSDIWALGNIFVEMLTGRAPFDRLKSIQELKLAFRQKINLDLTNISKSNCAVIQKMLQLKKQNRCSVEELYAYLFQPSSYVKITSLNKDWRAELKVKLLQFFMMCVEICEKIGRKELQQLLILLVHQIHKIKDLFMDNVSQNKTDNILTKCSRYRDRMDRNKQNLPSCLANEINHLYQAEDQLAIRIQEAIEAYRGGWDHVANLDWLTEN